VDFIVDHHDKREDLGSAIGMDIYSKLHRCAFNFSFRFYVT